MRRDEELASILVIQQHTGLPSPIKGNQSIGGAAPMLRCGRAVFGRIVGYR